MSYDVIFDKGHGYDTYERTGGKGVVRNGKPYEEHTANADIGDRVIPVLRAHGLSVLDIQPSMQAEVRLNDRMTIANRKGAKLYWSTHFNAGSKNVKGVCAFYSAYVSVDERTKALAEQYAKNAENMGIATHGDGTHASHYDSWTNLAVTRMTKMSAILCENGFMTNDDDFEGVFGKYKKAYHQKIAELQIKTILGYFGKKYDGTVKREPLQEKKGELTMSEYDELKGLINKQNQEINELKDQLADKMDTTSATNEPSDTHADAWQWLIDEGITDGTTPLHYITREQTGTMLKRYNENNEYLPNWMYDEIVDRFEGIAPYLHKPDEWEEKVSNHEIAVPELLGVFMLGFLNKENTDKVGTKVK